jgi:hypothetical protein
LIADPFGLFGPGWSGEYNGIGEAAQRNNIKQQIEEIRSRLGESGRNVPEVPKAWINGGQLIEDYSPAQLERFRTIDNFEALRKQGIVELDANWNLKSVASGRELFINPRDIRFTQEWVSYKSSPDENGRRYTLDEMGQTARNTPDILPALDVVVMPDGRLTSIDNRRLTAAKGYDAEQVKVRIRAGEDVLTNNEIRRLSWEGPDNTIYMPRTWAEAVRTRILKQGPEFNSAFRLGSSEVPRVEYAPRNTIWYQEYITSPTSRKR